MASSFLDISTDAGTVCFVQQQITLWTESVQNWTVECADRVTVQSWTVAFGGIAEPSIMKRSGGLPAVDKSRCKAGQMVQERTKRVRDWTMRVQIWTVAV